MTIMQTKVAIWGNDQFDLIIYLSRIIFNCNKKILLVDHTRDKSLKAAIPIPSNTCSNVVDYRGVDFVINDDSEIVKNYDVVLFNIDTYDDVVNDCDQVIIVSDQFDFHIRDYNESKLSINPILVVRDIINYKVNEEYIANLLLPRIAAKCVYEIYQDSYDYKLKLDCYYNNVIKFTRLSKDFKEVLMSLAETILKEQRAIIKSALKKAERGM